jgi:hypothetical protein
MYKNIDIPNAGAMALIVDRNSLGERAVTPRGPSAIRWVLTTANAAGINGLTCLPKHEGV